MRWLAFLLTCILPLLLAAQDTIVPGTFTVRKVYEGSIIPDGLGVFGNLGGATMPGDGGATDNVVVRGIVKRTNGIDTVPMRSMQVRIEGSTMLITTDKSGEFSFTISNAIKTELGLTDSVTISMQEMDSWGTSLTVPLVSNKDPYEVVRFIPDPPAPKMSRKERRREILKRIFLPWMWFKKKEKLPPRMETVGIDNPIYLNSTPKLQVLSQVGE